VKIVIAPDSFKGNIESREFCSIAKRAICDLHMGHTVTEIPMADGGEGTVNSVIAATGGIVKKVKVTGPLGNEVTGVVALIDNGHNNSSAIIEMASASGINLVSENELNPLEATSYGTGELIAFALNLGVKNITVGLGGSATIDGGVGMAMALGIRFEDEKGLAIGQGGAELCKIARIITEGAHPGLKKVDIKAACDVNNPLIGPQGAARVYGPQKGATLPMIVKLEKGLENLFSVLKKSGFVNSCYEDGDGAAGGMGIAMRAFCNAQLINGAGHIADLVGFEKKIKNADLLITGEGQSDSQTLNGKLCFKVAEIAKKLSIPVILVSGAIKGNIKELLELFDAVYSISTGPGELKEALNESRRNLYYAIWSIIKTADLNKK
jgi:glycerate kinase